MNKNSKGFTLIELLVVIAIIGILAALVLVSLGNARSKAQDARIKSDLAQLHILAEIAFDSDNSSYAGVEGCMDAPGPLTCDGGIEGSAAALIADLEIANGAAGFETESVAAAWCASSALASDAAETICVDSSGVTATGAVCTAVLSGATGLCV